MSDISLTVHRSTQEIGGNCIELTTAGERLILDVGRPLDAAKEATGLLPATLDLTSPVAGLLISHSHQDHYGLLDEAPTQWPVYCGEGTRRLMAIMAPITGKALIHQFTPWSSDIPFHVGPFTVTPSLTDHSAFDAYMLLIEAAGRRILYSGDFRTHGRKAALIDRLMTKPPPNIDVLLLEGTNLGSGKSTRTESDLEEDFASLFKHTPGRVFVAWSAQNIDRTVTLYRACLKAGRTLVVDLYTADVMETLADMAKLPRPGWRNLKVVITRGFSRLYKSKGRQDLVDRMVKHGIPAGALVESPGRWATMVRPSLIPDFEAKGVHPTPHDAWSYSMWAGYLGTADGERLKAWFDGGGSRARHIHTSGHASPADLRAFAAAIRPKTLVPIHGASWDDHLDGFAAVHRLRDGEPLKIL